MSVVAIRRQTFNAAKFTAQLRAELKAAADRDRATKMAAYMKDNFAFYGVPSPLRKEIMRAVLAKFEKPSPQDVAPLLQACWRVKGRETQYVAVDICRRLVRGLHGGLLVAFGTSDR